MAVMHLLERQDQLEVLNRCFQEARKASGSLVLIAGEAGIGKRARWLSDSHQNTGEMRSPSGVPATPPPRRAHSRPSTRSRLRRRSSLAVLHGRRDQGIGCSDLLFEDLGRPERTCLVVLEDVHWADEATLDFLRYIGRRIQRTSAVFVATYRDQELAVGHPVRLALGELAGHQVLRMRLPPLSLGAIEVLRYWQWTRPGVLASNYRRQSVLRTRIAGQVPASAFRRRYAMRSTRG